MMVFEVMQILASVMGWTEVIYQKFVASSGHDYDELWQAPSRLAGC
jgi:hypothetical protein